MKKKLVSLLLACALVVSALPGCGNADTTASAEAETAGTDSGASGTESADNSAGTEGQEDLTSLRGNKTPTEDEIQKVNTTLNDTYLGDVFEEVIPNDYSAYPYKEDVTLDIWMPSNSILASVCPDLNDQRVFKQVEELTGIKLNFIVPTLGEETTDFNLMIASGDLPDIIVDASRYTGGVMAGVNDGAYLDLTDLIDEYMPITQPGGIQTKNAGKPPSLMKVPSVLYMVLPHIMNGAGSVF